MRKLILIVSAILAIMLISSPSYAKKISGSAPVPATAIRLAWTQSDSFNVYCYYQEYNIKTGQVINTYNRSYIRRLFTGCPAR
ncbi:hypothetical protein RHO15_04350 [Utexia brackfieldae]|uniref:hypothetical protein n=1 Tax=Utexia brackfieldae TaxID=3074108 RepID=UPI00370DC965